MGKIYLSLGSNLGDRNKNLLNAIDAMKTGGINILAVSSVYETEPVGGRRQPDFHNICVEAETSMQPDALLVKLKEIERAAGRKKGEKWGPRIIDIDILFYDNIILDSADLVIPHPEIQNRKFVLAPLAEIAGALIHPGNNLSINEMLEAGGFNEKVKRLEP